MLNNDTFQTISKHYVLSEVQAYLVIYQAKKHGKCTSFFSIGVVKVQAFLICNVFILWREHWEDVLNGINFENPILSKHLH